MYQISATVTSGEELEQRNIQNLQSLAYRLPSVRISTTPVADYVAVRGVASSLNLGFEQSVGTFVDGLYRGRSRSTRAALFDVERVEVLRGPQTTFFGNNAIAGAFNIATRKPSGTLEANAQAFYAPVGEEYSIEGGVSIPLNDNLAVRLAARQSGMDGYIENENLGTTEPHLNERIGRLSAVWQPSSSIETVVRLDLGQNRNRGILSNQILSCPPEPVYGAASGVCARYLAASGGSVDDELDRVSAANPSFFDYDFIEAEQSTTIDLGRNSLILTTGYFDHNYDLVNDVVPVPASMGGSVIGTSQAVPARFLEDFEQFSQEVRFQSDESDRFEYMAGIYYSHSNLSVLGYQGFFQAPFGQIFGSGVYSPETPIAVQISNREVATNWSIFGSATLHLAEAFRLNLGLRYSIVSKDATREASAGSSIDIPGPDNFVPGPPAFQNAALTGLGADIGDFAFNSRTDRELMPSVSVEYDLASDVMVYASYTHGFKAGGFSGYFSSSIFDPELVDAYEIGLRSQLFNRRLTFNLTAFYSDYTDLQETTTIILPSGGNRQVVGNVAGSVSKGIELSTKLSIMPGLDLSADVSYLDATYTDYVSAPCTVLQQTLNGVPCFQDLSGKRRAFAPEWSGSVAARYVYDISEALQVRLSGSIYFTSMFFAQPLADPELSQDGYTSFDARIGVGPGDGRWELALVGKNLSDTTIGSFWQPTPTSPGSYQAILDPPRSIGIQLSFKY